jgi:hypothetical protein
MIEPSGGGIAWWYSVMGRSTLIPSWATNLEVSMKKMRRRKTISIKGVSPISRF